MDNSCEPLKLQILLQHSHASLAAFQQVFIYATFLFSQEKTTQMMGSLEEKAQEVKDKTYEAAQAAKERTRGAAQSTKDKVQGKEEVAKGKADVAKGKAWQSKEVTKQKAS